MADAIDATVAKLASWPEVRRAKAMLVLAHRIEVALEGLRASAELIHDTLDQIEGEPDLEQAEPVESDGDDHDAAWIEWTTMRGPQKRGPNIAGPEDDEEDDPAEDDDPAGQCDEDGINTAQGAYGMPTGPGCALADPGDHSAWIERIDQTTSALPVPDCPADVRNGEDSEDDDPDAEHDGREPCPDCGDI